MIPDGLEDLGFIDDAFVLRVAAAQVSESERDAGGVLAKRADFVREVAQWAAGYAAPTFARDARSLVKLRSFLATRLPA